MIRKSNFTRQTGVYFNLHAKKQFARKIDRTVKMLANNKFAVDPCAN